MKQSMIQAGKCLGALALVVGLAGFGPKPPKGSYQCGYEYTGDEWYCEPRHHPDDIEQCWLRSAKKQGAGDPKATLKEARAVALDECQAVDGNCSQLSCWQN